MKTLGNIEKKLFMESYLDICVMCTLTYNSWTIPGNHYWRTLEDIYCQSSAVISGILLVIFPVYGIYILFKHQGILHNHKEDGIFIENIRTKTYLQTLFNPFAMVRRFSMVIILVVLNSYPFF